MTEPVTDPRSAFPCSGGESQALARIKHYFWDTVSTSSTTALLYYRLCTMCIKYAFFALQDAVASYKETRNGLIGVDYSTKFAPW